MNEERENILINVFISAGVNKLQLSDIYYTDKIKKVIPGIDCLFDWNELNDGFQRERLMHRFSSVRSEGYNIIDGNFLLLIPGAIDPHVHFNTPGFEFRDTFQAGSLAAAYGGVTTVIDMPCTSIPPVTTLNNFNIKREAVKNKSRIDYAFWGGVSGNSFNSIEAERNIKELAEAGAAGFKVYTISGMDSFRDLNYAEIEAAAKIVGNTGKPLAVHAEDKETISINRQKLSEKELHRWESYCKMRSAAAEEKAVLKIMEAAQKTECKVHIVHLSSLAALGHIKNAQRKGLNINTETCPHYLYFTQDSFRNSSIRNYLKTDPPVKSEFDREGLWQGLKEGSIAFVATDHAGCDPDKEKTSENFSEIYGGIPGVEHRVPFLFSEGFLKDRLNLEQTINLLSSNAAGFFGFKNKGFIKAGYDADFALINLWSSQVVSHSNMHSKGKYTPFEGITFNADVEKTFLRGKLIMDKSLNGTEPELENNFSGKLICV